MNLGCLPLSIARALPRMIALLAYHASDYKRLSTAPLLLYAIDPVHVVSVRHWAVALAAPRPICSFMLHESSRQGPDARGWNPLFFRSNQRVYLARIVLPSMGTTRTLFCSARLVVKRWRMLLGHATRVSTRPTASRSQDRRAPRTHIHPDASGSMS